MRYKLTDAFCKSVPHPESGQKFYFDAHRDAPAGFALRVTRGAKAWTLSYLVDGRQRRMTLPCGFPAWGPEAARKAASKLLLEVRTGGDPLEAKRCARAARAAKTEADRAKAHHTLGALLTMYSDTLEAAGRPSATKVRASLHRHVRDAWPKFWNKPAEDFRAEDAVTVLASLHEVGKDREAGKLRAYIRAAYGRAVGARLNPKAPQALRDMGLRHNPVAELPAGETPVGTRERALSADELRAYWKRIQGADSHHAMMRLHVLTGGQRVEQLSRATVEDLDRDAMLMNLRDPKGRRSKPRQHVVPLVPAALEAIDLMRPEDDRDKPYLLTTTKGRKPAGYSVLQHAVAGVAKAMVEAGEAAGAFTPGDLRRTVETRLSALGVSKQTRAHLLSHGLGGLQDVHYDKHDHATEKRDALLSLFNLLQDPPPESASGGVTPIRKRHA